MNPPPGYSVVGWSGTARGYPAADIRSVAGAPDGFYAASNVRAVDILPQPFFDAVSDIHVARVDVSGGVAWETVITGVNSDSAHAVAVDQAGFVYVVGSTSSPDFPRLNSHEDGVADQSQAAFLWKIDPTTDTVVYSTVFGGSVPRGDLGPVRSEALDVVVDEAGVAYVAGWTDSPYFPVTEDAVDGEWNGGSGFGPARTGFVAKFAENGTLLYATYLGGEQLNCSGGSNCIPVVPFTQASQIVLGPGARLYVAGFTNTTDFVVTDGAYQGECRCSRMIGDLFVARFAPELVSLEYATYLGGSAHGDATFPVGQEDVTDLAIDSSGAAYVVGWTSAPDFPTTVGAFQPEFHREVELPSFVVVGYDGFAAKLSPGGDALEYSTLLGGFGDDRIAALTLEDDGSALVSGFTASDDFPAATGFLARGSGFLARLNPTGSAASFVTRLALGEPARQRFQGGLAVNPAGNRLAVSGGRGVVVFLEPADADQPAVWAVAGAADVEPPRFIAPGELVSLYGVAIGPEEPASFELDANGRVPTVLAGVRVRFDGTPAPVLYAQSDQVNVVAPFSLDRDRDMTIELSREGFEIAPITAWGAPTSPGVFPTATGFAVLNDDGVLNTSATPAERGAAVAVWATGAGRLTRPILDGSVAEPPYPGIDAAVRATVGYDEQEAEVVYAGAAPGLVNGVVQINVRIPGEPSESVQGVPLVLEIGGVRSPPAFVWVQ